MHDLGIRDLFRNRPARPANACAHVRIEEFRDSDREAAARQCLEQFTQIGQREGCSPNTAALEREADGVWLARFGFHDQMDYARFVLSTRGDLVGAFTHTHYGLGRQGDQWCAAARNLLEGAGVPFAEERNPWNEQIRSFDNDAVRYTFQKFSDQITFSIAVDRGLIDQQMAGQAVALPSLRAFSLS